MPLLDIINQKVYTLKTFEQLQFENLDTISKNDVDKFFSRMFINKTSFFMKFTTKTIKATDDDKIAIKYICEKMFKVLHLSYGDYRKLKKTFDSLVGEISNY